MDRTWSLEIAAKKHLIEVEYGRNPARTGKLMVDGKETQSWLNSQWLDLPQEITFEVGGGFRSDDQDAADHKDDAGQVYAQVLFTLAPGVYLVPEIGYFDYFDNSAGDDEGYEWYAGAKWQIDF